MDSGGGYKMKTQCIFNDLIGLKIVTVRGYNSDKRKKHGFEPQFILFNDKKTILMLDEQDYYSYHDCNPFARSISIKTDKRYWEDIMNHLETFPKADMDI
jgi:hypothetical protein